MRSIASLNLFCYQHVNTVDAISKSVLHIQTELEAYLRTNDKILKISFIYPPKILSHLYKPIFKGIHLKAKRHPTQSPVSPNQVGSLSVFLYFPSPHLFRYLLYHSVHVKCLSTRCTAPPVAVIVR